MKKEDNTNFWSQPTTLEGRNIRLAPLTLIHLDELTRNLIAPNAWHTLHWNIKSKSDLEQVILKSIEAQNSGIGNNFVLILKSNNSAIGKSHFMEIKHSHKTLEIGGTWISHNWHKTFVNTETKLLMLGYSFEELNCQRVEFRVDALNFNSQRAVLRIGAKYEGELRNSTLLPDGRKRDYKIYSIIDSEWPNIKITLNSYLDKYV